MNGLKLMFIFPPFIKLAKNQSNLKKSFFFLIMCLLFKAEMAKSLDLFARDRSQVLGFIGLETNEVTIILDRFGA